MCAIHGIFKRDISAIEKMVDKVIDLIMEDKRIKKCELEIDKVGAVKDVDSFSVTELREKK